MATCARCGSPADDDSLPPSEYDYCSGCLDTFNYVKENGVSVVWVNNHAGIGPPGYNVNGPAGESRMTNSQIQGLAFAKDIMDKRGCRGLFVYRGTRSRWLIDEYLQQHPSIAQDVYKERTHFVERLLNLK